METTSDKLSDRLKDMLLETGSTNVSKDNTSRPLIQVIDDKKDVEKKMTNDESDDELPPDIFPVANTTGSTASTTDSTTNTTADPARQLYDKVQQSKTLTEQMLADAKIAKKEYQEEQSKKDQQRAKKSSFGMKKGFLNSNSSSGKIKKGDNKTKKSDKVAEKSSFGMTKGFLNSKSSSGKKDGNKKKSTTVAEQKKVEKKELIYELDSDGNIVPPTATSGNNIKHNTDKGNPLHLSEVQSAILSHMQTNSEQWATPEVLDSITQNHPKLAQGLQNPQFLTALQSMQSNPKETLERLKQTSPEIVDMLMEFCGVLGEHFTKLGENSNKDKTTSKGSGLPPLPSQKIREIGPLEKKALEKHQKESKQRQQSLNEDEEVAAILGDEELHSILLDPKMQEVMSECSKGNKLNYYMSHPEIGPKLQRLVQAKLMQVA